MGFFYVCVDSVAQGAQSKNTMIIAGYDISYSKTSELAVACVSVFNDAGELIEEQLCDFEPDFPYIPGQLYKREIGGLERLLPVLEQRPEVLVIDGCGTMHPDKFGAACQYHKIFGLSTVGCAKNLLCGEHEALATAQGSKSRVMLEGEHVGYVFRSAEGVKPVYISSGCDLSQDEAVAIVARFCQGFRVPEVTRRPDMASRARLRELEA